MINSKQHDWLMEYLRISPDAVLIMKTDEEGGHLVGDVVLPVPARELSGTKELLERFPFCAMIVRLEEEFAGKVELCGRGETPEQALAMLVSILQAPPSVFQT